MKILLIVPKYNFEKEVDYNYIFPLGLGYIASTLKKAGYEVDCLNMNHIPGSVEKIVYNTLNSKKYDIVCSGGNALLYSQFKIIIETTHGHSSSPLFIIGGPIITSEAEFMYKNLRPDFAVSGEGEKTVLELLEFIGKKGDFSRVKGIVFRDVNENVIITPPRDAIKNIEEIPYPDFESFGFEEQLENMHCNDTWSYQEFDYPRTYALLGSRGCPFNCSFCWHSERYRARSIKDIMKELRVMVKKFRINNIQIYDECFSANKERLHEFCKQIKELSTEVHYTIKWHCQLIVSSVDDDTLNMMKDAGCGSISYGFESFSPKVLKSMRKPATPEQMDKAFKATLRAKIAVVGNFIFGDIAETKETAMETLDYWKKNTYAQITLGFVEPYPGSDLYKHCLRKGIIKDKLDFIQNKMGSDARINMTDYMTDEEIQELSVALLVLFSKYMKFVRPKGMKKMKPHIYMFKVRCPHCGQTAVYKNCYISNQLTWGFHLICRNCKMRFVLVSALQKLAYKHYSLTRAPRNHLVFIKKKLKEKLI